MTTREKCIELSKRGLAQSEIATIVGVSRQRVAQITGKYTPGHFTKITEDACVYPLWRKWMNDNRVTRTELIRRMGIEYHPTMSSYLSNWMRGKNYPVKENIDKLIMATGLTYEQLFYREV
jgi:transcriptional regulator with XRE-family HTH domain